MGIIKSTSTNNLLTTTYGFSYEQHSVTGVLKNCYEKTIKLSNTYYAWIAVDINTSCVVIYIEFECGGEVATYNFTIDCDFNSNPEKFVDLLDEEVTNYIRLYI